MKTYIYIGTIISLFTALILCFFSGLDPALEIDSLKEHIKLQRQEIRLLESIANSVSSSCKISVAEFEEIVRANGSYGDRIVWRDNETLIGPYRVKKQNTCMTSITLDWIKP